MEIAVINTYPIFKINTIENKKRKKKQRKIITVPSFITNNTSRISFAIKLMLKNLKSKTSKIFYEKFNEELLLTSEKRGEALFLKKELQKQGFLSKYLYKRFRW